MIVLDIIAKRILETLFVMLTLVILAIPLLNTIIMLGMLEKIKPKYDYLFILVSILATPLSIYLWRML